MGKLDTPDVGDEILFEQAGGCRVEVDRVLDEQPLAADGIVLFEDQYGETKLCARDGGDWVVVMDSELTPEQSDAVFEIMNPGALTTP